MTRISIWCYRDPRYFGPRCRILTFSTWEQAWQAMNRAMKAGRMCLMLD